MICTEVMKIPSIILVAEINFSRSDISELEPPLLSRKMRSLTEQNHLRKGPNTKDTGS